jgi:metal-responsive CopG/Arc/MetJ family transcriptional regulator
LITKRVIAVSLDEFLLLQLDRQAVREDRPRSAIVGSAVDQYLRALIQAEEKAKS